MLSSILKSMLRLALRVYFRKVHVLNLEAVGGENPVLLVSNHPASLLDIIVLAVFQGKGKKSVSFLVPEDYLNTGMKRFIFRNLNCIPLTRVEEAENMLSQETLGKCRQILKDNSNLIIFGEYQEVPAKRIESVNNDAFQIASDAEESFGYGLGIQICAVGINYSYFNVFRSDLMISFHTPFPVIDFKDEIISDKKQATAAFNEKILTGLKDELVIIEDEKNEILIERLLTINRNDCEIPVLPWESKQQDKLRFEQIITGQANLIGNSEPKKLQELNDKTSEYFEKVKELGINDRELSDIPHYSFAQIGLITLSTPLFVIGWLMNCLPLWLTYFFTKAQIKQMEHYSAVYLISGSVFYTLYITVLSGISFGIGGITTALAIFGITLTTGFYALYFRDWGKAALEVVKFWSTNSSKKAEIAALKNQRNEIIQLLIEPVNEKSVVKNRILA